MTSTRNRSSLYGLSHPTQARPPTELPTRAWRVYKADGKDENFYAHHCTISNGALAFYNQLPETKDLTVVRALSPNKWESVIEIDTPASPPLHLGPYDPVA